MKELKVYLGGAMGGLSFGEMNTWRIELREKLLMAAENVGCNITIINPVDYYNFVERRYQSEREIKEYDLAHVSTSNVMIVNLDKLINSDGTKYEMFKANYIHKIPVIAFGDKQLYDKLHPWTKEDITRVEKTPIDVVNYIRDFYMV